MLKLVTRGIRANLGRLSLTLVAVVLGVSAVSGSFVLADSLRAVFDEVINEGLTGVDAQVRGRVPDDSDAFTTVVSANIDQSVVDDLTALPEVRAAAGYFDLFETIHVVDKNGNVLRPQGPPVLNFTWVDDPTLNAFEIEGEPPGPGTIAIDDLQAKAGGISIGDTVTVALPDGSKQYKVSGIVSFEANAGAYFTVMDLGDMQQALNMPGQITAIDLAAAEGVSGEEVAAAVNAVISEDLEAVSKEELVEEGKEEFGQIIDIFGNILLGFAFVILFVSTFIIYNTFVILVGQRTRQIGLLRSIGASRSQVRTMVLIEATIIGLIASLIGLVGGLGIAWLLQALFRSAGGGLPEGPLRLLPRTVMVVFAVGLFVTVASALFPALRASRVAPLEAIRTGGVKQRSMTFRLIAGALVLVPGVILFTLALTGSIDSTSAMFTALGLGGALIFVGVAMLSALFAGPVAGFLGRPVQSVKGMVGRLARDNASRNPQRTSATATALMIGLALITGVAVLSSSIVRNLDEILKDAFGSDLVLTSSNNQGSDVSPAVIEPLREIPEVMAVSGVQIGFATVNGGDENGNSEMIEAWDSATGSDVLNLNFSEGTDKIGVDGVAVSTDEAAEKGISLGDPVEMIFEDGETKTLTVKGIFENFQAVDGSAYVIDRQVLAEHSLVDGVSWIGVTFDRSIEYDSDEFLAARAKVDEALVDHPTIQAQDTAEFRAGIVSQINQLQTLIVGLLAMCIIVAFFGIVNTMVLSVLERTREIGLLRAVGTTRPQLRSSIRWEAIIVSLFGSLLGVSLGVLLGWAAVTAIPDEFLSFVAIPWFQIIVYVAIGGFIGVVAAFFPAVRASRLNVLDAISYE